MRVTDQAEYIINRIDRIEEDMRISDELDSYYHDELMKIKEDIGKIMKHLEVQSDGDC